MVTTKKTTARVKKESGKNTAKKVVKPTAKTVKKVTAPKKSVLTRKQQNEVKKIATSCQTKTAKSKGKASNCAKTEPKTNNVIHDEMIGKKFNGITILESAGSTVEGRSIYRCGCDCGTVFLASGTEIRVGRKKSCGCQGGRIKRSHYLSKAAIVGALEVLNQVCMDYNCSQLCPLWETCHSKMKGSIKQFSKNALKEMENRRD